MQRCQACGTGHPMWADVCSRCGQRLQSEQSIKNRGVILIILGVLLCAGMGYISLAVAGAMLHSGSDGASLRYTGSKQEAMLILGILGTVFSAGVAILCGGVWQVVYGRRNQKILLVSVLLLVLTWVVGAAFLFTSE